MACFLCYGPNYSLFACVACDNKYCCKECLLGDSIHPFQCKLLQKAVECDLCMKPIAIGQGFVTECGHGIHGTCATFCEAYGLHKCPRCPSGNRLKDIARLMLLEYIRCCSLALETANTLPDLPTPLLDYLVKVGALEIGDHTSEILYIQGTLYANGLGLPMNEGLAYTLFSRAAALGHGPAMFAVSSNNTLNKLKVAAKNGSSHACVELAALEENDPDKVKWLRAALEISPFDLMARFKLAELTGSVFQYYILARHGHISSIERLARKFYDEASNDIAFLTKSMLWATQAETPTTLKVRALVALHLEWPDQAFDFMSRAALTENADATYELARFHLLGVGTPVDANTANLLLEKAAAAGHAPAQYDLAMRLYPSDRASELLQAAAKTHAVAMHFLARLTFDPALLERAGTRIPAALYDLAVIHARKAEWEDTVFHYQTAIGLIQRAVAMPTPTFQCYELDVAKAKAAETHIQHRLIVCDAMREASVDTLLRMAQFLFKPVILDLIEIKINL